MLAFHGTLFLSINTLTWLNLSYSAFAPNYPSLSSSQMLAQVDLEKEPSASPTPTSESTAESQRIYVSRINVTANTEKPIFGPKQTDLITKPSEGKELTLEELGKIADAITQLYLNEGYLNSRAIVPPQEITDGIVEIRIIEGSVIVDVQGTRRLNKSYIESRIQLGIETPFKIDRLEEQLRLLKTDPLIKNVQATLEPIDLESDKDVVGQSKLIVIIEEAPSFFSQVGVDNYSPPSVGSERFNLLLGYRNIAGLGDEISVSYYPTSTGGVHLLDANYRIPLNPMNGTLQLRASPYWQKITQSPFDELDITANRELYEISYRQPLIRTLREEFALSIGFSYQDGQTFVFDQPTPFGIGPDENGVSRTSVINFGQDYIRRDRLGAWALRSQFNFGTGLFDATTNDAPIPDGHFFSWLGQVQRVQQLSDDHLLIIQADIQLTPDSLLPAYQFVIGGGQLVRGYRQNARSGDNGFRFSIEDRFTVLRDAAGTPTIQLAPFLDMGAVWNAPDNPNLLPDQRFLIGAGMGVIFDSLFGLKGLSIRLDYGYPFINLDDRGHNLQDDGFYFQVIYRP